MYYLGAFATGIPSWMTSYYMDRYLKNRTFYKIQSQSIIDNPDRRIVDDLSSFTATTLAFSLTLFNATVDLSLLWKSVRKGTLSALFTFRLLLGLLFPRGQISCTLGVKMKLFEFGTASWVRNNGNASPSMTILMKVTEKGCVGLTILKELKSR